MVKPPCFMFCFCFLWLNSLPVLRKLDFEIFCQVDFLLFFRLIFPPLAGVIIFSGPGGVGVYLLSLGEKMI